MNKRNELMIRISQDEAFKIRSRFPKTCIAIVNKQKKSKHKGYFVEEAPKVLKYLREIRGE